MPPQPGHRLAGQRASGFAGARHDQHGHGVGDGKPSAPFRQLAQIISAHQPDEVHAGKFFAEGRQGFGGVGGVQMPFDIGGDDVPAIGDAAGGGQAIGERRHPGRRFQRVAGGDHQPELVQPAMDHRRPGDVQMADMRRVERAA